MQGKINMINEMFLAIGLEEELKSLDWSLPDLVGGTEWRNDNM